MRVALLPLDDRPPNLLFPQQLAAIAGIDLVLPPEFLLGWFTDPGDPVGCAQWLLDTAPGCDAVIVSLDMLCFGGLMASRRPTTAAEDAIAQIERLRALRAAAPQARIYAHGVIPRLGISVTNRRDAAIADEITRLAQTADLGRVAPSPLAQARWGEFLQVRARNQVRNRAAIPLVADGTLDFLYLSQEDAAPTGPHRAEQGQLIADADALGVAERVVLAPGADEAGCLLLARSLVQAHRVHPRWTRLFFPESCMESVAPFEDRPLRDTVSSQLAITRTALQGEPTEFVIILHGVEGTPGDWANTDAPAVLTDPDETAGNASISAMMAPVALADVASANGGDPALLSTLTERGIFPNLAGLAAWNTAANSIGTAVAQAICRTLGQRTEASERAHRAFLACRALDDYFYQSGVRAEAVRRAEALGADPHQLGDYWEVVQQFVQERLVALGNPWYQQAFKAPAAAGERAAFEIALPWARCFEVEVRARLSAMPRNGATDD